MLENTPGLKKEQFINSGNAHEYAIELFLLCCSFFFGWVGGIKSESHSISKQ
jgi:hypothetical protein